MATNEQLNQLMKQHGLPVSTMNGRELVIPSPVTCGVCGKVVSRQDLAFSFHSVCGSPGHPELPPFQCSHGDNDDHWSCSIECWSVSAHKCIDEHMVAMLNHLHTNLVPKLSEVS